MKWQKYQILQKGFFLPSEMGFFLSFQVRLVMFITFVKEKEQTLLEGIHMVKQNKNPFQLAKTKSHLRQNIFFTI